MVASLDSTEVHKKLSELLQENEKLKETLKQNNIAMKQQFNTLASWQEEIMKVHQNHKKKFVETRELINYLKKENTELKMKLSSEEPNDTKIDYELLSMSEKDEKPTTPVNELQGKMSLLTDELSNSKLKCEKLSTDVEKLLSISNLMSSQLMQATSTIQEQRLNIKKLEVETAMLKSNDSTCLKQLINCESLTSPETLSNSKECEKCILKDKEISSLKKTLFVLEDKLRRDTTPVQTSGESSVNSKKCHQQHSRKIQQYSERLQELTTCFDKQFSDYAIIENSLKELLQTLEANGTLDKSCIKVDEAVQIWLSEGADVRDKYNDQLYRFFRKLIDEQHTFSEYKEHKVMAQNQFQKALLDCDSIVYDLETLLGRKTEEYTQKTKELEKQNTEDEGLVEHDKVSFTKMRENFEEEKKAVEDQRRSLEMIYKSINHAKELLHQGRMNLHEEKLSLDQQSQLYESQYKELLETEKQKFEAKHDQLVTEIGILHESIQNKDHVIQELQREIESHVENIKLVQTQLHVYEEDFRQERKLKELLLEEKSKLSADLQKHVDFKEQLQQEISHLKSRYMVNDRTKPECQGGRADLVPPVLSTIVCPLCNSAFSSIAILEQHVDSCLSSN